MINIRTLRKISDNGGLTLKNGKIISYKSGWQVATEGIETKSIHEAMKAIKNYINECVRSTISEELKKQQIRNIVEGVIKKYLINENENTNKRQAGSILNDPTTNNAQIADIVLPKDWEDSTKRSYISKLKRKEREMPDDMALDIINTQEG